MASVDGLVDLATPRYLKSMLFYLLACTVPTSDLEVLGGFEMEWDVLSHRVSRLEVGVSTDGAEMAMVGGDWSTGDAFSDFLHYRLATLDIREAQAGFGQVRIPVRIKARGLDEDGELAGSGRIEGFGDVPISMVGSWPEYTAVIQGFGIHTDVEQSAEFPDDYDSSHGYPLGRLAIEVGAVVRGDTTLSVAASLLFEPAATGESILDRPAMDSSIPFAAFEGWVDVGIVGHQRAGADIPVDVTGTHAYSPPYSPQEPIEVPMDFGANRVGMWQSMEFEVNPGGHGDYIRAIGAELVGNEDIDAVRMTLTNSSAYELAPMSYRIGGRIALLDLGRKTQVYLRLREGEAGVGAWEP